MAHQCVRNAIELSGIAGYKLVEMKLIEWLAQVLSNMGGGKTGHAMQGVC
jgi:hypothetical protein